jgi:hypothetical protein
MSLSAGQQRTGVVPLLRREFCLSRSHCAESASRPSLVQQSMTSRLAEQHLVTRSKLTAEVESFLDDLYESDPASHQLVNQAILILERNGPRKAGRWWTPSRRRGSRT